MVTMLSCAEIYEKNAAECEREADRAITQDLESKYREIAQQWREMAEQRKLLAMRELTARRFNMNEDGRANGHQSHQSEPQYSGHPCSPLAVSLAMLQEFNRLQPRSATTNQGNPQPHLGAPKN
jgi:hypothetical protein